MRALLALALLALGASGQRRDNYYRLPSPYTYTCTNNLCSREEKGVSSAEHQTLEKCLLSCGTFGSLWPMPTGETVLSKDVVYFNPYNMRVNKIATSNDRVADMLEDAVGYFRRNVHFNHPHFSEKDKTPYNDKVKQRIPQEQVDESFEFRRRFNQFDQRRQQQQRFREEPVDNFREHNQIDQTSYEAWERYTPFRDMSYNPTIERKNINLEITVTSPEERFSIKDTDESYNLVVQTIDDETTVTILATTYYGARHALESLSQLIAYDNEHEALMIVKDAKIQDKPQYRYRGLMVDTSRNYYTKDEIMSLLDTMSQNKLNVFHWHITDAASFPMYSNRLPQMAYYGSYSPRKVYYPQDISEIVRYARHRGITVIPELDTPAHTAAGWQWGEREGRGKLVLCTNENEADTPWFEKGKEPPAGQLNIVNPEVYNVLGELYRDIVDAFDPEMFHFGADDVSFKCFDGSPEIKNYLAGQNIEPKSQAYFDLWNSFQNQAYAKLREASEGRTITPIIHSSSFARNYLNKDLYVIQMDEDSNDTLIADYVNNGYTVIFSNPDQWRLDCNSNTWYGDKAKSCPPFTRTWYNFYDNSPLEMLFNLGINEARSDLPANRPNYNQQQEGQTDTFNPKDYVLGGTASLWSSQTDGKSYQAKTWPLVSALAERLWSDPTEDPQHQANPAVNRLSVHRGRMVNRGTRADPLEPEICLHDQRACYSQEQFKFRSSIPQ